MAGALRAAIRIPETAETVFVAVKTLLQSSRNAQLSQVQHRQERQMDMHGAWSIPVCGPVRPGMTQPQRGTQEELMDGVPMTAISKLEHQCILMELGVQAASVAVCVSPHSQHGSRLHLRLPAVNRERIVV